MTINYLPLFLALSTSSPFFDREFTGLHSYRSKVFEQLPRAGIPEYFDSYNHFSELISSLKENGVINTLIVTLFQALCLYAQDAYHERFFHQIVKQNKWNAVRYSLDGEFLFKYGKTSIRNAIMDLITILEKRGIFKELKTQQEVKYLKDLVMRETISSRMIKEYRKSRSYKRAMRYGVLD